MPEYVDNKQGELLSLNSKKDLTLLFLYAMFVVNQQLITY